MVYFETYFGWSPAQPNKKLIQCTLDCFKRHLLLLCLCNVDNCTKKSAKNSIVIFLKVKWPFKLFKMISWCFFFIFLSFFCFKSMIIKIFFFIDFDEDLQAHVLQFIYRLSLFLVPHIYSVSPYHSKLVFLSGCLCWCILLPQIINNRREISSPCSVFSPLGPISFHHRSEAGGGSYGSFRIVASWSVIHTTIKNVF